MAVQPKLFDSHAHFFSADTSTYPVDVTGAREGEAALLHRIEAAPFDAETLLDLWTANGVTAGAAVQFNSVYKSDNRYALEVGDKASDRTSTVVMLNAADPSTPGKLERFAQQHNLSGLRLFGYPDAAGEYTWLDSDAALKSWETAARLKLSMVVMYAPSVPSEAALQRIARLAKRFDQTPIAVDHCGWAGSAERDELVGPEHRALADVPNVAFKFTQINLDRLAEAGKSARAFVTEMVEVFGPDRLMWGSDVGNTLVPYDQMVAAAIDATADLDEDARRKVLHDNGLKMFRSRVTA